MGGVRLAVSLSVFARPTPSASDGPLDEDLPLVPAGMGAPGSNPRVPTKQTPTKTNLPKANPRRFRTFREIVRGSRFSSCWLLLVFFRVRIRTQIRTRRSQRLTGSPVARGVDFHESNGPEPWHSSRPLRDRRPARRGRDGRGLPGEGHEARTRGGDQGAAGRTLLQPRAAESLRGGGALGVCLESSEHRYRPRDWGERLAFLHRHGIGGRGDAAGGAGKRTPSDTQVSGHRRARRGREGEGPAP